MRFEPQNRDRTTNYIKPNMLDRKADMLDRKGCLRIFIIDRIINMAIVSAINTPLNPPLSRGDSRGVFFSFKAFL